MVNVFLKDSSKKPSAAIFLSGSGTNAEKLLEHNRRLGARSAWHPALIVTDRPRTSRAREIAEKYGLPLLEHSIFEFYRAHGQEKVTLATPEARHVRDLWTDQLRAMIAPYKIDFGLLAGFVPLTNIVSDFPCLNVHPGDLTVMKDGRRYLVGLHSVPIELAILSGATSLRSSVILVQPYTPGASEMDSGPLLGISEPCPADLMGHSLEELRAVFVARKNEHRHGANKDLLSIIAAENQERLKEQGDWIVYPQAAEDFARGCFGRDEHGQLCWREDQLHAFQTVRTIEYGAVRRLIR